jgi:hypothetical protein
VPRSFIAHTRTVIVRDRPSTPRTHTLTRARTHAHMLQAMHTIADWREKVGYYNFFDEMHPIARDFHRCVCVWSHVSITISI